VIEPTVDTETTQTVPEAVFSGETEFIWYNSSGDVFSWLNSLAAPFLWLTSGYAWFRGDVETTGHYLGVTIESTVPQFQLIGIQLQYRVEPSAWGSP
jgi:hypothetical protein